MSKNLIIAALLGLCLASAAVLVPRGLERLINHRGGAWQHDPENAEWLLSESAQSLIAEAYEGLSEKAAVVDQRVNVVSFGQAEAVSSDDSNRDAKDEPSTSDDSANESYINPQLLSWKFPRARFASRVYLSAAGIHGPRRADEAYLTRLFRLARAVPQTHRFSLVAHDQRYSSEGEAQPEQTPYYVANDFVWELAQRYPQRFTSMISIHPYREDAVEALKKWAKRGVKNVSWVPVSQVIDPADERLEAYYQVLVDNGMVLHTDLGDDRGLNSDFPDYGNPLLYRRALDQGVTVIMARCASNLRFGDPENAEAPERPAYEWFIQLANNSDYAGHLYGDMSGLTHETRVPDGLNALLQSPQVFPQLVYASDYPTSAISAATNLTRLQDNKFITEAQARDLREIYSFNPLLFDFVLKRLVRLPQTDLGFAADIFTRKVTATN